MSGVIMRASALTKEYQVRRGALKGTATVKAVNGVNLDIRRGETIGLVGESGCGKTTLGRMLVKLLEPTSGKIEFDGKDVTNVRGRELKEFRRRVQIVFQDPFSSLDPRARIGDSMAEPLLHHGVGDKDERQERVAKMLEMVGLHRSHATRFPHEFSGGQRQRIGIGRALILRPDFVVADEPVSALDVSVQAQILNLLADLQQELSLTLVFVAHNLAVVEHISDRVAVMYLGRIVELAERSELFSRPTHPYTEMLLDAVPASHPRNRRPRAPEASELPSPLDPPAGCLFHPRCPIFEAGFCDEVVPPLHPLPSEPSRLVACHVRIREGQTRTFDEGESQK